MTANKHTPVDVLAVMDRAVTDELPLMSAVDMKEARAAVAELIEADMALDAAASEVASYEAITNYRRRNYRTACYANRTNAIARREAALSRVRGAE